MGIGIMVIQVALANGSPYRREMRYLIYQTFGRTPSVTRVSVPEKCPLIPSCAVVHSSGMPALRRPAK